MNSRLRAHLGHRSFPGVSQRAHRVGQSVSQIDCAMNPTAFLSHAAFAWTPSGVGPRRAPRPLSGVVSTLRRVSENERGKKDVTDSPFSRSVFVPAIFLPLFRPLSFRTRLLDRSRELFPRMRAVAFLRFDASGEPPFALSKSAKLTKNFFRVCSCGGMSPLVHGRCGRKDPRKHRARPVRAWRILGVRRTLRRLFCGVVSHRRRGRSGVPQTPGARVWGQRLGQPEEDGIRKTERGSKR